MRVLAIELNDVGIRAASSSGDGLLPVDGDELASPGFALRNKGCVVTGHEAERSACLHVGRVHDRFWDQLDTEPVDAREARSPNRAEIAFEHLRRVVEGSGTAPDDVVIAVPSFYEPRNLGMLTGMAGELELPLRALVALPVAMDLGALGAGTIVVVELTRHRSVVSIVETGDGVVLSASRVCPNVGLRAFRRQWVKAIGSEFVRRTRFDPLHDAATEQQVHDRIPELLETLARDGADEMTVETGSAAHRLTVTDQLFTDAGRGLVFELCGAVQALTASARVSGVALTHEAAQIPGLRTALQRHTPVPMHEAPAGAAALHLATAWPERFAPAEAPGVAYYVRAEAPGAIGAVGAVGAEGG